MRTLEKGKPHCVWEAQTALGEGPVWSTKERALYWVDIKRPAILCWGPNGKHRFPMPEEIGCMAIRQRGGLVAAFRSGFVFIDQKSWTARPIHNPEPHLPDNRFNDGKCDRAGRFWAGSMDDRIMVPSGSIWRLDVDLTVEHIDEGFIVSNGFGWNPDNTVMYVTDSENRVIYAYAFDLAQGQLGKRRIFARIPEDQGYPDGLTVDILGGVWSAHWDGWRVTRYHPDGRVDKVVKMPVPRPTSCTFGGPNLDRLYVTSASIGLSGEVLTQAPLSGGLFEIDVEMQGLPEPQFGG